MAHRNGLLAELASERVGRDERVRALVRVHADHDLYLLHPLLLVLASSIAPVAGREDMPQWKSRQAPIKSRPAAAWARARRAA